MRDLVIYGAGGLGKEIACLIKDINNKEAQWNLIGFLDDNKCKGTWFGLEILGNSDYLKEHPDFAVVVAVGDPTIKKQIVEQLSRKTYFPTLIHPNATLLDSKSINLGQGCIITSGSIITCNVNLERFVLVNLNTTIGHDVHIGKYSSLMCGVNIAGEIEMGECTFVGSGANVLNGINLGSSSKIGAGAVVIENIPKGKTAVGIPARFT